MSVPSNIVSMQDPTIPINQGIYEESTTQLAPLGQRLRVGDRTFRYASAGTNLLAGRVYCQQSITATKLGCTIAVDTAATNKKTITITAGTNIAANNLAEGYVSICSSGLAGGGLAFKISSHASFASGGTACVLNLYDGIPVGTVAAGPANIVCNAYSAVVLGSQALDNPVGMAPIAVTSGNYCWLQTWGIAPVMHEAATPAGAAMMLGTLGELKSYIATGTLAGTGYAAVDYGVSIAKNLNEAATAHWAQPVILQIAP